MADNDLELAMRLTKSGQDPLREWLGEVKELVAAIKQGGEESRKQGRERRAVSDEQKQQRAAAREAVKTAREQRAEQRRIAEERKKSMTFDEKVGHLRAKREEQQRLNEALKKPKTFAEKLSDLKARRDEQKKLNDALKEGAGKEQDSLSGIRKHMQALTALHFASVAFGWARSFASAVQGAWDLQHVLSGQFELFTRNRRAAKELFDELQGFGANTGNQTDQVGRWATELQEAGVRGEALKKTLAAIADVRAMGFNGEAFVQAAKSMRDIELTGRKFVSGQELIDMFKGTGLDQRKLEAVLFKHAKIDLSKATRFDINRALAFSRFDLDKGMGALRRAIQDATGKDLGDFAAEVTGGSIDAKLAKIGESLKAMLADVDWEPVIKGLDSFFKQLSKPEAIENITAAMERFVGLLPGLISGLEKLLPYIDRLTGVGQKAPEPGSLGFLFSYLAGGKPLEKFKAAPAVAEKTDWAAVAKSTAEGYAQGIRDATPEVVKAATELATASRDAVKKAQDIHSPSRVMRKQGRYTGQGYELGITDSIPAIRRTATRMAATVPAATSNSTTNTSTSTSSTSTSRIVHLTVNWPGGGSGGPSAGDELEWRAMLGRVLAEAAEQI